MRSRCASSIARHVAQLTEHNVIGAGHLVPPRALEYLLAQSLMVDSAALMHLRRRGSGLAQARSS